MGKWLLATMCNINCNIILFTMYKCLDFGGLYKQIDLIPRISFISIIDTENVSPTINFVGIASLNPLP